MISLSGVIPSSINKPTDSGIALKVPSWRRVGTRQAFKDLPCRFFPAPGRSYLNLVEIYLTANRQQHSNLPHGDIIPFAVIPDRSSQ